MSDATTESAARWIAVTENVTVDGQPAYGDFSRIADAGFRSIINIRHDGERMPMTFNEQEATAEALGMEWRHVPIYGGRADVNDVQRFRAELASAPGPVYVHCRTGHRSSALGWIDVAAGQQWDADEALEEARQRGLPFVDRPDLVELLRTSLKEIRQARRMGRWLAIE